MTRQAKNNLCEHDEFSIIHKVVSHDWSGGATGIADQALFEVTDWDALLNQTWSAKIRPMMTATARAVQWSGVPAYARASLEADEQQCHRRTMDQLHVLATLLPSAEEHGHRLLVLRGVPLSVHLYGSPFIRESFDLDLLVAPQDQDGMQRLLAEHGFVVHDPVATTPRQSVARQRYTHHVHYRHGKTGTVVECHSRLDPNDDMIATDFEVLWARRQTISVANSTVAIPGQDDLLHILGMHASRHAWSRWKWIADIVTLLRRSTDTDIARQRAIAVKAGNGEAFDSWLLITQAMDTTALPVRAAARANENRRARHLADLALRYSTRKMQSTKANDNRQRLREIRYRLAIRPTWQCLSYEAGQLLHHPEDWTAIALPDRFFWLYYVLRPLYILKRRLMALYIRKPRKELQA